jgi:hypothetical protein
MPKTSRSIANKKPATPMEFIEHRIFLVRGQKIMLSTHLAELYDVEPRILVQAVKRNIDRFPKDFMFQLSNAEFQNLKSQIVISSWGGLRRANPFAFTEHGVAMLSSVLNSPRAVQMNILIIRAFVKLREILASHKDLARKIENLEHQQKEHGRQLAGVYSIVKSLIDVPIKVRNPIGYKMTG